MKLPLTYVAETLEKLFGPGHDWDDDAYDYGDLPSPTPSIADSLRAVQSLLTAAHEAAGAAADQLAADHTAGPRVTRARQLSELITDAIVHADRLAFVHTADVRYDSLMRERT